MAVGLLRRRANRTEIGSERSSGWTELWSERAGLPRQGVKPGRTAHPRSQRVPQG